MKKISITTDIISSYGEYFQAMNMEAFLSHNQIFTTEELRTALELKKSSSSTLDNLLAYHLRRGHIVRIRRGLYYTIPRGANAKTYPIDPYLIASKMTPDAILAYHTSLGFHGKLYSLRTDFIYVTRKKLKPPFSFHHNKFKGVSAPKGILVNPDFGIESVDYQGCKIRVTTLERTFVDILDRPSLVNNWEEIWRSLESIEYLNIQQVLAYAKLLNNATTYARIAFFLDQHHDSFGLSEKDLAVFHKFIPKSPHYLDPQNKKSNQLIAKWNLIVPKSLLQRAWEEPHENF